MAYQKHIVNRRHRQPLVQTMEDPRASAQCDGCGFVVNHDTLEKHMQYRGGVTPVWDGLLVCPSCADVPNIQLSRQVLQPDPLPVKNPRPIQFGDTEFLATEEDAAIATEDDDQIEVIT